MKSKMLKCAVFLAWFTVCAFTEDCTDEFEGVQNQCDCSSYSSGTLFESAFSQQLVLSSRVLVL